MVTIRQEKPEDVAEVRRVNELAFEQPAEANLVDKLRDACADALSLVAVDDGVVGHILFTPVVAESGARRVSGMGLAPMAVAPDHQRQGIGSKLVQRGLDMLRQRGCPSWSLLDIRRLPAVRVRAASTRGLVSQWDGIPDAAFMVLILDANAMIGVTGVARYREEFDEVA